MVSNFYLHDNLSAFNSFRGVFAPDTLPQNIFRDELRTKLEFIIINSENLTSGRMGHWLAFSRYREEGRCVLELFDSLAFPCSLLGGNIMRMIAMTHFDDFKSNQRILQNITSNYCGLYCIARFLSLLQAVTLEDFLEEFNVDKSLNDRVAVMYIRRFKLSNV